MLVVVSVVVVVVVTVLTGRIVVAVDAHFVLVMVLVVTDSMNSTQFTEVG